MARVVRKVNRGAYRCRRASLHLDRASKLRLAARLRRVERLSGFVGPVRAGRAPGRQRSAANRGTAPFLDGPLQCPNLSESFRFRAGSNWLGQGGGWNARPVLDRRLEKSWEA